MTPDEWFYWLVLVLMGVVLGIVLVVGNILLLLLLLGVLPLSLAGPPTGLTASILFSSPYDLPPPRLPSSVGTKVKTAHTFCTHSAPILHGYYCGLGNENCGGMSQLQPEQRRIVNPAEA